MTPEPETLIRLDHVGFSYGHGPVLEDITLEIKQGDFVGIIGPNGSGKTTLLRIILGFLKPTAGAVTLCGCNVDCFGDWRRVGYVPQRANITSLRFPVSVGEVVGMAHPRGLVDTISGKPDKKIVQCLEQVGIHDTVHKLMSELSGGQQQLVFIARALISDPEILILDEPTVGVDTESQTKFYELLKDLNQKKNLTLIMVSHDVDVIAHEVKTIVCINKTMVFHGKPREVIQGDFLEKLYSKNVRFVVHGH